ncbi:MAG: hypothetical protein PHZ09_07635 [Eubacteriales bacterium]|nr:hypothetical protein [Eubacteriales bacterium]
MLPPETEAPETEAEVVPPAPETAPRTSDLALTAILVAFTAAISASVWLKAKKRAK